MLEKIYNVYFINWMYKILIKSLKVSCELVEIEIQRNVGDRESYYWIFFLKINNV